MLDTLRGILKLLYIKKFIYYRYNEVRSIRYQSSFLLSCICEIFNLEKGVAYSTETIDQIIQQLKDFIKRKKITESETQPMELKLIELLGNKLKELSYLLNSMDDNSIKMWINIGKCWTHIGVIEFLLFSIFEMVDPVLKLRFKKSDCEDDVGEING